MSNFKVGPRGEPSWPHWRLSKPGVRVRHVQTGWTGTVVRVVTNRNHGYVRVKWDVSGSDGVVVAPAFDLEVIK